MFTRPRFQPSDPTQRDLLNRVAGLVDEGRIRTTLTTTIESLTAENVQKAHAQLKSGATVGKVALTV
jgi:NADPH:quinone reductase-like Zn-dependent oxidoreductase